jgi:predicted dehydrogenase
LSITSPFSRLPPVQERLLRIGVIGLGVGQQHLVGYENHPNCEVVTVCDFDDAKLRTNEGQGRVKTTVYAEELIADKSIDVVSIASNDDDHFDHVVQSLRAGKHVFVEKPLCQTLGQLSEIKSLWQGYGGRLKLQSNLVLRAAPVYRWLKQEIATDALGELFSFDGEYLFGRLSKITDGWRGDLDYYSVMAGGGIHLIDLLIWLTGERPETVTAAGNRICSAGTKFRFDDFVAATLSYPSGMIARITANFGCVHQHQHVVRVFGTKGTFLYDDQGPRVQFGRDPAPPAKKLDLATLPPSKHALIPDFIDAVFNDRNIDAETQADFDAMSVCFACEEALRTGTTQEVKYV